MQRGVRVSSLAYLAPMDEDLPLDDVRYVVVDVETTGGTAGEHRIIELGYCVIEGGVCVRRFSSLINPHQEIPEFIQTMTGITNDMVKDAPDEDEAIVRLAEELREDGTVFVGHNVGFDYGFIQKAFARQGEDVPEVVRLCTCKLSRRLSEGLPRHDLASVASFYGVDIAARHRALGDAEATAEVLIHMERTARDVHDARTLLDFLALQYAPRTSPRRETKARHLLDAYLARLPDEPGVYYFLSQHKKVLYVGKAKNLAKRVHSYFSNSPLHSRKVSRMVRFIRHITWETTGTELGALLLESREIRKHNPPYNSVGKEYVPPTFLRITHETFPRVDLVHDIDGGPADVYGPFRSERMAERLLDMLRRTFTIRTCKGNLTPKDDAVPCFDFHVKRCKAPCANLQTADDYNRAIDQARDYLSNVEKGAVAHLKAQMEDFASRLDFERAAMLRDSIKDIERVTLQQSDRPLSVRDTNVILLLPTQDRYRTVEVYMLRAGRLVHQRVVGTGSRIDAMASLIGETFFRAWDDGAPFSENEVEDLRIVTGWLYRHRSQAHVIVVNDRTIDDVLQSFSAALATWRLDVDEVPNEYSQL
jgi:DNA polymerase-3 subunit epsilon